jgi:transcriptional regulator with XRE-family HTH domain
MSDESKAETFGARVKEVREELGISVAEASKKSGISESVWTGIEDGSMRIKFNLLWNIALALEVRPHNLLV